MNRSEKLLEAIGQIDDRLILDAQKAGRKAKRKRVTVFRYSSALAVCAALMICVGVYGLLAREGLLLSPFEKKSESSQKTESIVEMEEAAAEEAIDGDAAVEEAAPLQARETDGTGNADGEGAGEPAEAAVTGESGQEEESETAKQADAENAAEESGETASEDEIDSRAVVTEASENSNEAAAETEGEINSEEQQEGSQEPMILSLRPEEEVSDNDMPEICELPAAAIKSEWVKTAGTDVTVSYSNQHSEAVLEYGSRYALEYETANGWEAIPVKENVSWIEVLYALEPGKSVKETVRLESAFGTLKSGHYRLTKNAALVYSDQTEDEIVLYTEFDLE